MRLKKCLKVKCERKANYPKNNKKKKNKKKIEFFLAFLAEGKNQE